MRRQGVDTSGDQVYPDLAFVLPVPSAGPGFDRVTVEIVRAGSGCELTLTQEMRPEFAEWADRTAEGWAMILDGLGRAVA